jgi:hypothetical protein
VPHAAETAKAKSGNEIRHKGEFYSPDLSRLRSIGSGLFYPIALARVFQIG